MINRTLGTPGLAETCTRYCDSKQQSINILTDNGDSHVSETFK
jgi:hypothetical protein